ncbi:MAG: hypothetical protein AAFY15_14565, partial [Cyanobacteria bacterium J06648_11]
MLINRWHSIFFDGTNSHFAEENDDEETLIGAPTLLHFKASCLLPPEGEAQRPLSLLPDFARLVAAMTDTVLALTSPQRLPLPDLEALKSRALRDELLLMRTAREEVNWP